MSGGGHRPAGWARVAYDFPEAFGYFRRGWRPRGLEAVARGLFWIALRVERELGDVERSERIAEGGDAIAAVLRECQPMLVCARFGLDSPLRRIPRHSGGGA